MESNGIVPTMNVGGEGAFGGNSMWIFALLILLLIGNGGGLFGGNGYGRNVATQEDLNFSRLENQVRANAELTERKGDAITNGICDLGYKTQADFAAVNQAVMESRFLNEKAITEATASLSAQIRAIDQKMDAKEIQALRDKVQALELAQATGSVVRYPTTTSYCSGANPFCGCGCGCNNNNI